jgi:hypothetical protein
MGQTGTITNRYEPSPQAKALGTVIDGLMDPRTQMMTGTGMLPGLAFKAPGWGAEALRRYKLIGGTPETLDHTLKMRAMGPQTRNTIVSNFRQGTDLAAPSVGGERGFPLASTLEGLSQQDGAMELAGNIYQNLARGGRPNTRGGLGPLQHVTFHRPGEPNMESASSGNAAYGAVSRQVGRMLDTPGFQLRKSEYGPKPLPFSTKSKHDFEQRYSDLVDRSIEGRRAGDYMPGAGATLNRWPNNSPQYTGAERRASGQRGGATSGGERYNYETQRWEPDDRGIVPAQEMQMQQIDRMMGQVSALRRQIRTTQSPHTRALLQGRVDELMRQINPPDGY